MTCEWTIFYDETRGKVGCIPTSKPCDPRKPTVVLKGFYGTEKEAIAECIRVEKERRLGDVLPHYSKYTR